MPLPTTQTAIFLESSSNQIPLRNNLKFQTPSEILSCLLLTNKILKELDKDNQVVKGFSWMLLLIKESKYSSRVGRNRPIKIVSLTRDLMIKIRKIQCRCRETLKTGRISQVQTSNLVTRRINQRHSSMKCIGEIYQIL